MHFTIIDKLSKPEQLFTKYAYLPEFIIPLRSAEAFKKSRMFARTGDMAVFQLYHKSCCKQTES